MITKDEFEAHLSDQGVQESVRNGMFFVFTNVENRKIIGKSWKIMAIIIMAFFGHFMVKLYLNNIFNGLIDFFCFILV